VLLLVFESCGQMRSYGRIVVIRGVVFVYTHFLFAEPLSGHKRINDHRRRPSADLSCEHATL